MTQKSAKATQSSKAKRARSTASSSTWNCPSVPRTCSWSVVITRDEGAALADQEVEVGAVVGLQHVVEVKAPVAARERRRGFLPRFLSARELPRWNLQRQFSLRDVELDLVAVFNQSERAAPGRLGADVQHHGAVRGAAHARVRDAHHVGDALLQELGRQ